MKRFVKTCKIANFTKMFKQIINKMEENNKLMERRLRSVTIDLAKTEAVVIVFSPINPRSHLVT